MLFSREDVATFINQNFEPAWEMVREVPILRIDFGNGRTTTRTLHGNVASYVCSADGQVADILPGIYTPAVYMTALRQPRELVGALGRLDPVPRLAHLRNHHLVQAQRLRAPAVPANAPIRRDRDVGKGGFERPLERQAAWQIQAAAAIARQAAPNPAARPRSAAELASWQPLVVDTQINESQRRLQIHDRFATADAVRPEQIKRWLYRDVLHADIDDPFMGLGDDLFADIER